MTVYVMFVVHVMLRYVPVEGVFGRRCWFLAKCHRSSARPITRHSEGESGGEGISYG